MLGDERDDRLGQLVLVPDVDAVRHVRRQDRRRLLRCQVVVGVGLPGRLVLDERERVRQLADVVVVGRDPDHQRIGAHGLGGPFREVADHQ